MGEIRAPLQGTVVKVVELGASVRASGEVVVIESMKMELAIQAPADGVVADVFVATGQRVTQGEALVALADRAVSDRRSIGPPRRHTSEVPA